MSIKVVDSQGTAINGLGAITIFDNAFAHLLNLEGGYSNHAADRGGATAFGVTEAVARQEGYQGPMQELPISTAKAIYKRRYWDPLHLDAIAALSELIARELFDTGVNMGISTAAKFLQRALNALNHQQAHYADLAVDGLMGRGTVAALAAFLAKRGASGATVLHKALNSLQGTRYIELVENRPLNGQFIYGWLSNRVA